MKNRQQILESLVPLINEISVVGVNVETISEDMALDADLGMDSLHNAELCIKIENKFTASIPDAVWEKWETVKDVVDAIWDL